jgi:serine/threonine protein kinase
MGSGITRSCAAGKILHVDVHSNYHYHVASPDKEGGGAHGQSSGAHGHVAHGQSSGAHTTQRSSEQSSSSQRSSGLAARRAALGQSLKVATKGEGFSKPQPTRTGSRSIRWCNNIAEMYKLGEEVMHSSHSGMEVRFASQTTSGQEMVIKVRDKKKSFKNSHEEKEWRVHTEFMLNLPPKEGIVRLYAVWEDQHAYYVVMEKVEGADLFETLSHEGLMPTCEVKEVMRQLLTALTELHGQGLIHKDLKLENVMIERCGMYSDFQPTGGKDACVESHENERQLQSHENERLARHHLTKSATEPSLHSSTPLTVKLIDFDTVEEYTPKTALRSQDVLGTDQYIAQEAYDGNYSPASDIFAAGVIAYRLLTNRFPFKRDIFDDKVGENWVGSPKMLSIRDKVRHAKINWDYHIFETEPQARDLLQRMLAVEETHRPSAEAALAHVWLHVAGSHAGAAEVSETTMSSRRTVTPPSVRKCAWEDGKPKKHTQ